MTFEQLKEQKVKIYQIEEKENIPTKVEYCQLERNVQVKKLQKPVGSSSSNSNPSRHLLTISNFSNSNGTGGVLTSNKQVNAANMEKISNSNYLDKWENRPTKAKPITTHQERETIQVQN
jgi:hypothetical protein